MPQLDLLTFLPQFTWFAIFFTLFYFRVVTVFLPKIAETLKVRKKVKEQNVRDRATVWEETQQQVASFETILKQNLNTTQKALVGDRIAFNQASEKVFDHLNHTSFGPANEAYLEAIADTVLAEHVLQEVCDPALKIA